MVSSSRFSVFSDGLSESRCGEAAYGYYEGEVRKSAFWDDLLEGVTEGFSSWVSYLCPCCVAEGIIGS